MPAPVFTYAPILQRSPLWPQKGRDRWATQSRKTCHLLFSPLLLNPPRTWWSDVLSCYPEASFCFLGLGVLEQMGAGSVRTPGAPSRPGWERGAAAPILCLRGSRLSSCKDSCRAGTGPLRADLSLPQAHRAGAGARGQ